MPCFHPLKGYQFLTGGPILFREPFRSKANFRSLMLPCGQCVGCRLERSRVWAVRCVHEAHMYEDNCFVTLTYRDDCVPEGRTLVKKHFQDFMKRLRDALGYPKLRYYMCGEYGERFGRPHYHACLFNYVPDDREFWRVSASGDKLYKSGFIDSKWRFGTCIVGSVTFESAAYVARYIMDKVTGDVADQYYEYVDADGVVYNRLPEYTDMSRKPGIGKGWIEKFRSDVYPNDRVILDGHKFRPPRFYDDVEKSVNPGRFLWIKDSRVDRAHVHRSNNTPDRLQVREELVRRKLKRLPRGFRSD